MPSLIEKVKRLVRERRPGPAEFRAFKALRCLAWNLGWDRAARSSSFHHTELPPSMKKAISDAIQTLHAYFGPAMPPGYRGGWDAFFDEDEGYLSCDAVALEEARARAAIGQIEDCLHHLERALPEGYGVIAERLAHHFRSRP
jgi:hypothetical protein